MTDEPITLTGRRVLVPGGTGGVGEGVVRAFLHAGATVTVPTRSAERAAQLQAVMAGTGTADLITVVADYSTFASAERLVERTVRETGGLDHIVAPIGGWWSGGALSGITEEDWRSAFVDLATTHLAVLRASLPRIGPDGSYVVVVGDSALHPVPGSGLVSMEQAALLMMQQVAAAETPEARVFSFVLGQVHTRSVPPDAPGVAAGRVGEVAVAVAAASLLRSRSVPLHDDAEVEAALRLAAGSRRSTSPVTAASRMEGA